MVLGGCPCTSPTVGATAASARRSLKRSKHTRVLTRPLALSWRSARPIRSALPETPPPFEQGRKMLEGAGLDQTATVLALKGRDIIGITVTTVNENGSAYTTFTGVTRAERGLGIALALKLEVLQVLKQRGTKLFGTTNDKKNGAMRRINERLGYVPDPPTTMNPKALA